MSCLICYDNPAIYMFDKCKHLAICEECNSQYQLNECCLCRQYSNKVKIFSTNNFDDNIKITESKINEKMNIINDLNKKLKNITELTDEVNPLYFNINTLKQIKLINTDIINKIIKTDSETIALKDKLHETKNKNHTIKQTYDNIRKDIDTVQQKTKKLREYQNILNTIHKLELEKTVQLNKQVEKRKQYNKQYNITETATSTENSINQQKTKLLTNVTTLKHRKPKHKKTVW